MKVPTRRLVPRSATIRGVPCGNVCRGMDSQRLCGVGILERW